MYVPEFPYKGKQIIISSGRVIVHAKEDSVFLFGKKNGDPVVETSPIRVNQAERTL